MSTGFHFASRSSRLDAAATATNEISSALRIADLEGLFERLAHILRAVVLVRQPTGISQLHDGRGHGAIVQLLSGIDLMPPRYAARVEMADPPEVVLDGVDDVALHDLHVVDVV